MCFKDETLPAPVQPPKHMRKLVNKTDDNPFNYACKLCYCMYFGPWVHIANGKGCRLHQQRYFNLQQAKLPARPFVPSWDMSEGNKRLMLLSAHLEHADARHRKAREPLYDQRPAYHPCGTPACAGGHSDVMYERVNLPYGDWQTFYGFGCWPTDSDDYFDIFSGLNAPRTAKQASQIIRETALRRHFAAKVAA